MELKVEDVQIPAKIGFNYEELKTQLTTRCEEYKTIVYTPDTIKEAKADRAMLNKLKDSLNSERIRRQKEYMRPFETFKNQVDDLIGIIDTASGTIDRQVKAYEQQEAEKKRTAIMEKFESIRALNDDLGFVTIEDIWDKKWLNKSKSLSAVEKEITDKLAQIAGDIGLIQSNFKGQADADSAEAAAMTEYRRTFDIGAALQTGKALQDDLAARRKTAEEKSALEEAAESMQAPQTEDIPEQPQEILGAVNEPQEMPQEAPQPQANERRQRVVIEITASEHQFSALNNLVMGAKAVGAQVRIISKEEL